VHIDSRHADGVGYPCSRWDQKKYTKLGNVVRRAGESFANYKLDRGDSMSFLDSQWSLADSLFGKRRRLQAVKYRYAEPAAEDSNEGEDK